MVDAGYRDQPPDVRAFSLVRGGLLWRFVTARGWVRRDLTHIERLAFGLALVAWLPPAVLASVEKIAIGWHGAFVYDVGVHARLLVAMPLALYAERAVGMRFESAVRYLTDARLIDEVNRASALGTFERAERMRDAYWVEALSGVTAMALSIHDLDVGRTGARTWIFAQAASDVPVSVAGGYYLVVSAPLFRFILFRWLWRIAIWTTLLIGLARAGLNIDPAHPDRAGGLSVLGDAHTSFGWLVASLATSIAGNMWTEKILLERSVMDYWPRIGPLLLALPLVFLLPLLAFAWPLEKARRRAHQEYGAAAADFARRYTRQWIDPRTRAPIPLGSGETSAHTDLNTSFASVRQTRRVPFALIDYLVLLAAAAIPMLVFVVQEVPLLEILRRIREAVG